MGGFSIQTSDQPAIRQSFLRGYTTFARDEMRREREPRTAQVDQIMNTDNLGALQEFLRTQTPPLSSSSSSSLCRDSSAPTLNPKGHSAQSKEGKRTERGNRRSLDIFKSGSRSIRLLLRSRSESPKPMLVEEEGQGCRLVKEGLSKSKMGHMRILQTEEALERLKEGLETTEAIEKLKNSSTYRVNCIEENAEVERRVVSERPKTMEPKAEKAFATEIRHSIPAGALTDIIERTCQMIDGISEEYPLMNSSVAQPTQTPSDTVNTSHQPHSNGIRYATRTQVRDFAVKDLGPKIKGYTNKSSPTPVPYTTTSSELKGGHGYPKQHTPHKAHKLRAEKYPDGKYFHHNKYGAPATHMNNPVPPVPMNARETIRQAPLPALPMMTCLETQGKIAKSATGNKKQYSPSHSQSNASAPFDTQASATGITEPSDCLSPAPAPTGPLPPLPENPISAQGSSNSSRSRRNPERIVAETVGSNAVAAIGVAEAHPCIPPNAEEATADRRSRPDARSDGSVGCNINGDLIGAGVRHIVEVRKELPKPIDESLEIDASKESALKEKEQRKFSEPPEGHICRRERIVDKQPSSESLFQWRVHRRTRTRQTKQRDVTSGREQQRRQECQTQSQYQEMDLNQEMGPHEVFSEHVPLPGCEPDGMVDDGEGWDTAVDTADYAVQGEEAEEVIILPSPEGPGVGHSKPLIEEQELYPANDWPMPDSAREFASTTAQNAGNNLSLIANTAEHPQSSNPGAHPRENASAPHAYPAETDMSTQCSSSPISATNPRLPFSFNLSLNQMQPNQSNTRTLTQNHYPEVVSPLLSPTTTAAGGSFALPSLGDRYSYDKYGSIDGTNGTHVQLGDHTADGSEWRKDMERKMEAYERRTAVLERMLLAVLGGRGLEEARDVAGKDGNKGSEEVVKEIRKDGGKMMNGSGHGNVRMAV